MKKELKEQNKEINFDLIDVLSHLDPTKTNKFLPLLVKELKKDVIENILIDDPSQMRELREQMKRWQKMSTYNEEQLSKKSFTTLRFIDEINNYLCGNNNISVNVIELLARFVELSDRNLIEEKDIQKYSSLKEINDVIKVGELLEANKSSEFKKQIVFENEYWLMVRPLTYETSVKYGYATRWCTAMRHEKDYFYRYTRDGALFYIINKEENTKFGVQVNIEIKKGISQVYSVNIYNEADTNVDSYRAGFPAYIMEILYDTKITYSNNLEYMRENEPECAKLVDEFFNNRGELKTAAEPMVGQIDVINEAVNDDGLEEAVEYNRPIGNYAVPELKKASFDELYSESLETLIAEIKSRKFRNWLDKFSAKKKIILFQVPLEVFNDAAPVLNKAFEGSAYHAIVFPGTDSEIKYDILR